jgi:hypothetical protein
MHSPVNIRAEITKVLNEEGIDDTLFKARLEATHVRCDGNRYGVMAKFAKDFFIRKIISKNDVRVLEIFMENYSAGKIKLDKATNTYVYKMETVLRKRIKELDNHERAECLAAINEYQTQKGAAEKAKEKKRERAEALERQDVFWHETVRREQESGFWGRV